MSALKKTGRPTIKRARRNNEVLVIEPSEHLFRVVVNNYKQKETESFDNTEEAGETMIDEEQGLPPQPTGYLKFPTYDPF